MREPSKPGAIVLLSNGEALLLVEPTGPWGWWNLTRKVWTDWASVSDLVPSIVHHGYTPPPPPTPEPTLPFAVVRDGEGVFRQRVMDCRLAVWMRADGAGFCPWDEVPQEPNRVEIIFPGVPDA